MVRGVGEVAPLMLGGVVKQTGLKCMIAAARSSPSSHAISNSRLAIYQRSSIAGGAPVSRVVRSLRQVEIREFTTGGNGKGRRVSSYPWTKRARPLVG